MMKSSILFRFIQNKKIYAIILIVAVISTIIIGCGKKTDETVNTEVSPEKEESPEDYYGDYYLFIEKTIPERPVPEISEEYFVLPEDNAFYSEEKDVFLFGDYHCSLRDAKSFEGALFELYGVYDVYNEQPDLSASKNLYRNICIALYKYDIVNENWETIYLEHNASAGMIPLSILGYYEDRIYILVSREVLVNESLSYEYEIISATEDGEVVKHAGLHENRNRFCLDNGKLVGVDYDGNSVDIYDKNCEDYTTVKPTVHIQGFFYGNEGNVLYYGTENGNICILDEPRGEIIRQLSRDGGFEDYADYSIITDGDCFWVITDGEAYYYDENVHEYSLFDQDFMPESVSGGIYKDNMIRLIVTEEDGEYVMEGKPSETNPKYLKDIITVSGMEWNSAFRKLLICYNRMSEDSRIVIEEDQFADLDYEDKMDKRIIELAAGGGADIIVDSYIEDYRAGAKNGYLVPLDDAVDVNEKEYITPVFDSLRVDGTLYAVPLYSDMRIYVTSDKITGGKSHWNIDEFMEAIENSGSRYVAWEDAETIIWEFALIDRNNKDFIDWEERKSNLDGEKFIKLLEFARDYSAPVKSFYDDNAEARKYWEEVDASVMSGETAGKRDSWFADFNEMLSLEKVYGDQLAYIGYPSENGTGVYLSPLGLAINGNSKNKEHAKQFLAWLCTEEGQEINRKYETEENLYDYSYRLPTRWDVLENNIEDFRVFTKNHVLPNGKLRMLTDNEIATYKELVKGAQPYPYEMGKIRMIIEEELGAFLEGRKTAEETAKVIDSRVQLYLDENR